MWIQVAISCALLVATRAAIDCKAVTFESSTAGMVLSAIPMDQCTFAKTAAGDEAAMSVSYLYHCKGDEAAMSMFESADCSGKALQTTLLFDIGTYDSYTITANCDADPCDVLVYNLLTADGTLDCDNLDTQTYSAKMGTGYIANECEATATGGSQMYSCNTTAGTGSLDIYTSAECTGNGTAVSSTAYTDITGDAYCILGNTLSVSVTCGVASDTFDDSDNAASSLYHVYGMVYCALFWLYYG